MTQACFLPKAASAAASEAAAVNLGDLDAVRGPSAGEACGVTALGQGLTLVPAFQINLSRFVIETPPNSSIKQCLSGAEKWTSVRPCLGLVPVGL